MAGVVLAIKPDGDLLWYRYSGDGTADQTGGTGWVVNSGNPIGRGWQNFRQVLGIGDGHVLAIKPDGDLLWYRYSGDGTADQTGGTGWVVNSGNPIGRGWQNFRQVLGIGDGHVLAIKPDGDLLWYRYSGDGTADQTGGTGWVVNSGNPIGRGWQNFRQVLGIGDGQVLAIKPDGDLLWYRYSGDGTADQTGGTGWVVNSGNPIGRGWQNFRQVLGIGDGHVLAIKPDGDLLWYRYSGDGTADQTGGTGWVVNSGNPIGRGWQNFRQVLGIGDGQVLAIKPDGDLLWYRYSGDGTADQTGGTGWVVNSGNPIGRGWQNFRQVLGIGDGHVLAIKPDGDLLWYRYSGDGTADQTGGTGWVVNSGNPIGRGWQNFRQVLGIGDGQVLAIKPDGDLLWYRYSGDGTADQTGGTGWVVNSGNPIGRGWQNFRQVLGIGDGQVLAIKPDGDLLWYRYSGDGTADQTGGTGWVVNSGNPIGRGWQNFRQVLLIGDGQVLAIKPDGDLLWYRYSGDGTADQTGGTGWVVNSGNPIG